MDSASVYSLELLVLEGTGGKTLATDHRDRTPKVARNAFNNGEVWNPVCRHGKKTV